MSLSIPSYTFGLRVIKIFIIIPIVLIKAKRLTWQIPRLRFKSPCPKLDKLCPKIVKVVLKPSFIKKNIFFRQTVETMEKVRNEYRYFYFNINIKRQGFQDF